MAVGPRAGNVLLLAVAVVVVVVVVVDDVRQNPTKPEQDKEIHLYIGEATTTMQLL